MSETVSDDSSHLQGITETDTAWGRSRFTEAEIKKAFELRDHELRKAEAEASAMRSVQNDSKSKSKLDPKREEEKRKKDESKRASKQDAPITKKKLTFPLGRKRNETRSENQNDDEEEDQAATDQTQEQEAWSSLLTYDFAQDALDLTGLVAEQSHCDSFEKWFKLNNTEDTTPKSLSTPIFASPRYQRPMEEALSFLQGSSISLTSLGAETNYRILALLDTQSLISSIQVCRQWRDYSRNRDMWRARFFELERTMFDSVPDVNIWEELGTNFATIVRDQQGQVKEASLNKLVAAVTPQAELPDMMDVSTFLVTYHTFTTTSQLIRKLMQRYIVPESSSSNIEEMKNYVTSVVRPIQMRVCKLFKPIIETQHRDIDDQLLEYIKLFVNGIVDQGVLAKQIQSAVHNLIKKKQQQQQQIEEQQANGSLTSRNGPISSTAMGGASTLKKPMSSLYDLSSEEIARHLTLIEFETFVLIKPTEFFGQAWAKPKNYHRAPNIRAMIDRFNSITRWITTEIVSEEKIRNRVKRVMKFIKVAQALKTLNNYHTLMAILAGLNEGPVFRLKFTKSEVPSRFQQAYDELQTLMSADGSYNAYRLELAAASPPCIPYIGVYLRDLTYFDEGASGSEGLINFKSKKNVYSVIQVIQTYQGTPYSFKANDRAYQHLKNVGGPDDAALHKLSLLREPKNAKRTDIL